MVPLPVADFAFVGSALAPWPNRLEDATWTFEGKQLVGEITESGNHNGLHGLLVRRDFEIVSQTADAITYRYEFGSDPVYPFHVVFEVTYQLTDAGLHVTMAATNRAGHDVPIAFGTHPYFAVDADSQLKVSASKASVNSARQLPISEQPVEAIGLKHNQFANFKELPLDDCLLDLGVQPETVLSRPALGKSVTVWQDRTMPYQMIFVRGPKFAGEHPVTIAIEPQTAPANALRSNQDLFWLTPGETRVATWGVRVS